jgi:outer membrane murein-binding lipoprotein Lpp
MDTEIYKLLLAIAGTLIVLLLGIIGFFLQKHIKVIELLATAVNALNVTVKLLQNDQQNTRSNCTTSHKVVNSRLNAHAAKLQEHGTAITELKTKIQ